jgi:hypothetical protein
MLPREIERSGIQFRNALFRGAGRLRALDAESGRASLRAVPGAGGEGGGAENGCSVNWAFVPSKALHVQAAAVVHLPFGPRGSTVSGLSLIFMAASLLGLSNIESTWRFSRSRSRDIVLAVLFRRVCVHWTQFGVTHPLNPQHPRALGMGCRSRGEQGKREKHRGRS